MKDMSMTLGASVTPTAASSAHAHMNANMNRRPRAQSLQQHFGPGDKSPTASASVGSPSMGPSGGRDCSSSGSFVSKLFRMVDSEPSSIVSWIRGGTAFCIVDPKMMAEHCLPKYFRHRRFSSLIRQLNFYSFYRVQEGQLTIYQHSFFRKGRPDLLVHIKRRGAGKAKDPWFDPLANSQSQAAKQQQQQQSSSNTSSNPSLNLSVIGVNVSAAMNTPSGMICYSPMSKRVLMENMSPALKPGMAPGGSPPPMVDMGGNAMMLSGGQQQQQQQQQQSENDKMLQAAKQRWEQHKEQSFSQMKHELFYDGSAQSSPMLKPSDGTSHLLPPAAQLDIDDFLTEDCSIHAGDVLMMKTSQFDERLMGSSMLSMAAPAHQSSKHAMVSRDLLKWDTGKDSESSSHVAGLLSSHDDDADSSTSFEDELLLDLANVEPGAWEVPLSPLNEEEDMMPWLDLCF